MNKREQQFARELAKRGFRTVSLGWPDFLAFNPKKKQWAFIEVKKRGAGKVPRNQRRLHEALLAIGIRVSVCSVEYETATVHIAHFGSLSAKPERWTMPRRLVGGYKRLVRATCRCGCGRGFLTQSPKRLYLNDAHRNAAWARQHRPSLSRRSHVPDKQLKP